MTTDLAAAPTTGTMAFACRDVDYLYQDRHPALLGVSFEIPPGSRVALVGANGSGKTTLLKLLAGLVFPTHGTVSAFGSPLTGAALSDERLAAAFRSRVGIVFQNPDTQVFNATVRDELAFGCLQLGLTRAQTLERVGDALALLNITDLADRSPIQLSGGQKKRVAIAAVLTMAQPVLLLDEPTAALDPRSRAQVVELLGCLAAAGRTLVVATHHLDRLADVADRAIVLAEDHTVAADLPVPELLADAALLRKVNLMA
jgi:cobalt/nickel transport system ATP-binding protein